MYQLSPPRDRDEERPQATDLRSQRVRTRRRLVKSEATQRLAWRIEARATAEGTERVEESAEALLDLCGPGR